jgi:hypothetical protein
VKNQTNLIQSILEKQKNQTSIMPVIVDATNQVNLTDSSVVHKNKEVNGSFDLEVKAV